MQKIYGGLSSSPVNKMDTFNGVALTRTYTGLVIDGSGPIADLKDIKFSPALPWTAGTRGTITLREPVTKEDLLNGALTFINGNGFPYKPVDNDGYVDYIDEDDNIAFSIAIADESINTVQVQLVQEENVEQIMISPAVGQISSIDLYDSNLQLVGVGETGFLLAQCSKDGETVLCALTQDGASIIKGTKLQHPEAGEWYKIFSHEVAVPLNSLLKLDHGQAVGGTVELPKVRVKLTSENNSAVLRFLHQPCDDLDSILYTAENQPIYWGDSITEICTA